MKTFIQLLTLLFITSSFIKAAPLERLSDKLTSAAVDDKSKERVPSEETHHDSEPASNNNIEDDENVEELDKLKSHPQIRDSSHDVIDLAEKLEDSLKKLHDENFHHRTHEEKPAKAFRGAARLASGQNAFETPTEPPTTLKQKEMIEILPVPEDSEVTTSATKNGNRRSVKSDMTLNAGSILRQLNGKYSAYDMAQYIFWTGDEQGVAKAVEELIDEGLMSRENAIEFLNDIRLGIDYLENTYSIKNEEASKNTISSARMTSTTTTVRTESPIDEPFNYNYNYQKFHSFFKPSHKNVVHTEENEAPTLSPAALKALEKIPSLMKLTKAHKFSEKQDSIASSFEDENGRSRLADFMYGEYSLEEVIYQLAKTMFTQSLTHGSEESQAALQKLTQFLENEGKHGRISPALQKKVLDVLLAALSDTLSENPEVMEQARQALIAK